MKRLAWFAVTAIVLSTSSVDAHHSVSGVPILSLKCGWIEGESVRDVRWLADFCAQSVPPALQIISATADRERLWIEASPQLVARVRADDEASHALLRGWLEQWRRLTGYRTVSVSIFRGHVDIAIAKTTMSGDVISVR